MSDCGCQTETCHCHDDQLGFLGDLGDPFLGSLAAITPDQATEEVFPQAQVRGGAGHNAATRGVILNAATQGEMVGSAGEIAYIPGSADCAAAAGVGISNNLKLAQTASGLALNGTAITLSALGIPIAGPFIAGISAIIGLFPMIFGHHAKAVKKEQSVLCAAVPAAQNYLQIIDQAVHSGAATPQDGIHALDSLVSDFRSQVSGIIHGSDPMSSGECNAACVMLSELRAIVLVKQSEYQDLVAGAAQTVTPARPNTTSPAGTAVPTSSYAPFYSQPGAAPSSTPPSSRTDWLPIAAVVVAGLFLMRGL